MTLVAFDTNILVYAEFEPDYPKGILAEKLLETLADRGLIAAQVLGEFLSVTRRRWPHRLRESREQVDLYCDVYKIVPTGADVLLAGSRFAERYRVQLWDAVIWQASVRGGPTILLTEDLQDGFTVDGMRALNPFAAPDRVTLARDLAITRHR